ncbi:DUF6783 domain-containing protein [Hungatella hathewayi]|uniref:DUF6783 domain-containing protein n=1 Tax=Hungatella hathewayi TaxID=154046 RepID=UPI00356A5A8E
MGYVDRMRGKYTAKWGVQMAGMNFQTHSRTHSAIFRDNLVTVPASDIKIRTIT